MTKDEAENLQLKVLAEVFDKEACATLLELIDSATEQQAKFDGYFYTCPNCGNEVELSLTEGGGTEYRVDFCPKCSQAIDWSEND